MTAPDAVEAAARALCPGGQPCDGCRSDASIALAAAAPLIAQQTLLDAAQAWSADVARAHGTPAELFLTARAATLTPKDTP